MSDQTQATASPALPRDGGCRCGRVRFRITAPPLLTMACHCTGCRKMTGSAFSLSAAIPSEGFAVTAGSPVEGGLGARAADVDAASAREGAARQDAGGASGSDAVGRGSSGRPHHFFCPDCMSWLFTRADGMDWFVNVRTTLLDDPGGLDPFVETWTSERLPWATTPAVHAFPGFPAMEDYAGLSAAYARRGGARAGR